MRKVILLLIATAALSGCATSKQIQGPNGRPAYFVKCGSAVIDKCYEEASRVCPDGYAFLDRQNNPNAMAAPTAGGGFMMVRGPNQMLVECK